MRLLIAITFLLAASAPAAEFTWTRMTGQYPVECAPILWDHNHDGTPEILAVNRIGQVMLWDKDGKPLGEGQDGTAATLPNGMWNSSPTLVPADDGDTLLFVSKEGLVVALDQSLHVRWQQDLKSEMPWARANLRVLPNNAGLLLCDDPGMLHCLGPDGTPRWQTQLPASCSAQPTLFTREGQTRIAIATGNALTLLDDTGKILWQTPIGAPEDSIESAPRLLGEGKDALLLCTIGEGTLCAVALDGTLRWRTGFGAATDDAIIVLPNPTREGAQIFCTGLWGNLYAFDATGKHLWTSVFRSKTRARPLLLDAYGDGQQQLLIPCYNQHAYLYSLTGELLDDLRTNGTLAPPAVLYPTPGGLATALLISTSSLLAHAVKFTPPHHPYENDRFPLESAKEPLLSRLDIVDGRYNIAFTPPTTPTLFRATVRLQNPNRPVQIHSKLTLGTPIALAEVEPGALIDVTTAPLDGDSALTHRNHFPITGQEAGLPMVGSTTPEVRLVQVDPFAPFDPLAFRPRSVSNFLTRDLAGNQQAIALALLSSYDTEITGTFGVHPVGTEPKPKVLDYLQHLDAFLVKDTPATNGETVNEALVPLTLPAEVRIPPHSGIKFLLRGTTTFLQSREYSRDIRLSARFTQSSNVTNAIATEELFTLSPARRPIVDAPALRYCTWDYLPSKWFTAPTEKVIATELDHGVNVFPRTRSIPTAKWTPGAGLQIDYTTLDEELHLIPTPNILLFQVGHPPIEFPADFPADQKRPIELDYFHQWRDHLATQGRDFASYAFYINDEPGLDYGKSIPSYLDAAALFREADPRFRIYVDPVPSLAWDDFQKLLPYIDVWCPNMRLVSGLLCKDPRIEAIVASGMPVWSYECVAQVKSLSPLLYNRANAWRAFYFGLQGAGTWTFSTTNRDHWQPGKAKDEEYALVYPGEMPVSSLRWEATRQGLADYRLLKTLEMKLDASQAPPDPDLTRLVLTMMEQSDPAFVESRDYLREGDRQIREPDPTAYNALTRDLDQLATRVLDLAPIKP